MKNFLRERRVREYEKKKKNNKEKLQYIVHFSEGIKCNLVDGVYSVKMHNTFLHFLIQCISVHFSEKMRCKYSYNA